MTVNTALMAIVVPALAGIAYSYVRGAPGYGELLSLIPAEDEPNELLDVLTRKQ